MEQFSLRSKDKVDFIKITDHLHDIIHKSGIKEGLCHVFIPHTTAGVTVNEAADSDVVRDIKQELNKIVPFSDNYAHMEGNSAAHIKTSLIGSELSLPIEGGSLSLGTWQGVFFCEFDGPRSRKVYVSLISE